MRNHLCEKRLKKAEHLLEWALADLQDLNAGMEVIAAIRTFLEQRGRDAGLPRP